MTSLVFDNEFPLSMNPLVKTSVGHIVALGTAAAGGGDRILLETGDVLLLETGDAMLKE